MSRMLIFFLIGYLIYVLVKKRSAVKIVEKKEEPREETYLDPVCGVYVAEGDAVVGRLDGERIHFCSMACLEKYRDQLPHAKKAEP
jgi:YHS domain-containing protein